jgi:hypothetical protein
MAGRYADSVTCACGKLGTFKCFVAMYPLGLSTRRLSSSKTFAVCATCIQPKVKSVNQKTTDRLKTGFSHASEKTLAIAENATPNDGLRGRIRSR